MSHEKPFLRVCKYIRLKLLCYATKTSQKFRNFDSWQTTNYKGVDQAAQKLSLLIKDFVVHIQLYQVFMWPGSLTLTPFILCNFSCFCYNLLTFSKIIFLKDSFRNTIRVSNGLDPDKGQSSVGSELCPNCL